MSTTTKIEKAKNLINLCIQKNILVESAGCIAVIFKADDSPEEQWVWMPKEQAAADLVEQNAFSVLEKALADVKRKEIEKLLNDCIQEGLLIPKKGRLLFLFCQDQKEMSWGSTDELLEILVSRNEKSDDSDENTPHSVEFLEKMLDLSRKCRTEFPDLYDTVYTLKDQDLVFSHGPDDHYIVYMNLDAASGGQIVENQINDEIAKKVIRGKPFVDSVENPEMTDIDNPSFFQTIENLIKDFKEGKFIGRSNSPDELNMILRKVIYMKYSLVIIDEEKEGSVCGTWIQDFTGTIDGAVREARETEKANSNRIKVAVVDYLGGAGPDYGIKHDLVRMDN